MNQLYMDLYSTDAISASEPDATLLGGNGSPPAIGETPQQNNQFTVKDFLGSIGSAARQISTTARDIGTAVGTVKGAAKQSEIDYKNAKAAAESPTVTSKIKQWWYYSSTNDKIIAGLGAAAVIVAVIQLNKK